MSKESQPNTSERLRRAEKAERDKILNEITLATQMTNMANAKK